MLNYDYALVSRNILNEFQSKKGVRINFWEKCICRENYS